MLNLNVNILYDFTLLKPYHPIINTTRDIYLKYLNYLFKFNLNGL